MFNTRNYSRNEIRVLILNSADSRNSQHSKLSISNFRIATKSRRIPIGYRFNVKLRTVSGAFDSIVGFVTSSWKKKKKKKRGTDRTECKYFLIDVRGNEFPRNILSFENDDTRVKKKREKNDNFA